MSAGPFTEYILARQPLRLLMGLASAYVAYPIAEYKEKRDIRSKLSELRRFYRLSYTQRRQIALQRLVCRRAGALLP